MHLDLRYPIGLLLSTYGAILALDGVVEGTRVLGINVNLWWGGVMIVAGVTALCFARSRRGKVR